MPSLMRKSLVALAVAMLALAGQGVSAQEGCLSACNQKMISCLGVCPQQCPTEPVCMQKCYSGCTTAEAACVAACGVFASHDVVHASPKEVAVRPAAAPTTTHHRLADELEKRAPLAAFNKANSAATAASASVAALSDDVKPVAAATTMSEAHYQAEFTSFVKKFNKKYTHDEFFPRYTIFKANLNKIRAHAMTKSTYTMAVNEFADMTFTEFHSKMTGYKRKDNAVQRSKNGPHSTIVKVADSIDWRQKGAVTPVKNQQQCGSCWAFSTTGSTEGAHAIKTGRLVSLSEQQLVDCSAAQGNNGCNGGMMDQGFQYIITNGGITTEAAYPYTAADGTCRTGLSTAATLSSFVDVTAGSEADLLKAVNIGPVSIAIEADQQCFQFYSGGVLSDPSCGTQLDHGVLVVGYGTDAATNTPYWIVKNSWGASWGEAGYIRLKRGVDECGIANEASYPVV